MKLHDRLLLSGAVFCYLMVSEVGVAQITPDETLGGERSRVTPNAEVRGGQADRIDGGATRGSNLFHSFQDFNVNEGQRVYFSNPDGIENILSRVTGSDISDILGTLGVAGNANLFLLNPNGIIFGPNARLDISGSFTASTGSRFAFPDGSEFSATNPQALPLLNVSVPIGLQYGGESRITNRGNLITGQDLTLSGQTLDLQGQLQAGGNLTLQANGSVQLNRASVSTRTSSDRQAGNISIQSTGVQLDNRSSLSAGTSSTGHAGNISINTGSLSIGEFSSIDTNSSGQGNAGLVTVNATSSVSIDGSRNADTGFETGIFSRLLPDSVVAADSRFSRRSGGIRITTPSLELIGGSQLRTNAESDGRAGDVIINANRFRVEEGGIFTNADGFGLRNPDGSATIRAQAANIIINTEELSVLNGGELYAAAGAEGNAGSITIQATGSVGSVIFSGPDPTAGLGASSAVSSITPTGNGEGGDITITARRLELLNGGFLAVLVEGNENNGGRGNAGTIRVDAQDMILASGIGSNFTARASINSIGQAGTIDLDSNNIELRDGAAILAETLNNSNGGNVDITARNSLILDSGTVTATTSGGGNAGTIAINTNSLSISGDRPSGISATATATATNQARGGNIQINSDRIDLSNGGSITAETLGQASAGNISLQPNRDRSLEINIRNGAILSASTSGTGAGGNLELTAPDAIEIQGNGRLLAETSGAGAAGDITMRSQDIILRDGVDISAATTESDGGDINLIDIRTLDVANSRISASAQTGSAGSVNVTATNSVRLSGAIAEGRPAGLFAEATNGGNAGSVNVTVTNPIGQLTIEDGAEATARSVIAGDRISSGTAGSIRVSASTISLDRGNLNVETEAGDGGSIAITRLNRLTATNSGISASTNTGTAGNITIDQDETTATSIQLTNSGITVEATDSSLNPARASAGQVILNTQNLSLENSRISANTLSGTGNGITLQGLDTLTVNNSEISASTADGTAGSIRINENEPGANSVSLNNGRLTVQAIRTGNAGGVGANARSLTLANNSSIAADTTAGRSGDINLTGMETLDATNSQISASTASGEAGNVRISATESIALVGNGSLGNGDRSGISVEAREGGRAGNITLTAPTVSVQNGAVISATTSGNTPGNVGGDITVNANTVNLVGQSAPRSAPTGIFSETRGAADGGNITFRPQSANAVTVIFQNNAEISALTSGSGNGGSIRLGGIPNVDSPLDAFSLSGQGRIRVDATANAGNAGSLEINTNQFNLGPGVEFLAASVNSQGGRVRVIDQAEFEAGGSIIASTESGTPGGIIIRASESILLSGTAEVLAEGGNNQFGGFITLSTPLLTLENGAQVSTSTNSGTGGDVSITADRITLNSSENVRPTGIFARSVSGIGGSIVINETPLTNETTLSLNGGQISASTISGTGGSITVDVDRVTLNDNAEISAASTSGRGGDIELQDVGQLELSDSSISASTQDGEGGSITIDADRVTLNNDALITARSETGTGGGIQLHNLDRLNLLDSEISASTQDGTGGSITVDADRVTLNNDALITARSETGTGGGIQLHNLDRLNLLDSEISASTQDGTGGSITIDADRITLNNNAIITASSTGGRGGNIELRDLDRLNLSDGSISASTADGIAGNILIDANESIRIIGNLDDTHREGIFVTATGEGIAGRLNVTTDRLSLQDGAIISVQANGRGDRPASITARTFNTTNRQPGDAGDLSIRAQTVALNNQSRIIATSNGGQGGTIRLSDLNSLRLNNSEISASTRTGVGGSLTANFRAGSELNVTDGSRLAVEATNPGTAGSLIVRNADDVQVSDGSSLTVSSRSGEAGNLSIRDAGTVTLDNGTLRAIAGRGDNGNIDLTMSGQVLQLNNGSEISAQALNSADGGRITLNVPNGFVLTNYLEDNDVIASASGVGDGGRVEINTLGIFGLEERSTDTQYSDIVVSSRFATDGTIELNTLGIDPTRGLTELPETVESPNQVARACGTSSDVASEQSSFVVTGRGGLPPNSGDVLNSEPVADDWVALDETANHETISGLPTAATQPLTEIVEAQGWIINDEGAIEAVAIVPSSTPQDTTLSTPTCAITNRS
jgi:filamentous hemagglutinin family protein